MTNILSRVIDPILSDHARGYRQAGMIAKNLFPTAFVQAYGGKVIQFGKESFRLMNSVRAPGGATKRVRFGYAGVSYAITSHSLEGFVPIEKMRDAAAVPGINLAVGAVNLPMSNLELEQEYNAAQLARTAGNYDTAHKVALTGTARWLGSASDPFEDMRAGREAIRQSVGIRPNTCVLSATAFSALDNNAKFRDRIKYTSSDSVTVDMVARAFQVKNVYVGEAVYASDDNDTTADVWGDDVILAYVSPGAPVNANPEEPSYGYTYTIEGMPMVEQPYYDENSKTWYYPVTYDATAVLSGMTAGYLIQGAGGAPA